MHDNYKCTKCLKETCADNIVVQKLIGCETGWYLCKDCMKINQDNAIKKHQEWKDEMKALGIHFYDPSFGNE